MTIQKFFRLTTLAAVSLALYGCGGSSESLNATPAPRINVEPRQATLTTQEFRKTFPISGDKNSRLFFWSSALRNKPEIYVELQRDPEFVELIKNQPDLLEFEKSWLRDLEPSPEVTLSNVKIETEFKNPKHPVIRVEAELQRQIDLVKSGQISLTPYSVTDRMPFPLDPSQMKRKIKRAKIKDFSRNKQSAQHLLQMGRYLSWDLRDLDGWFVKFNYKIGKEFPTSKHVMAFLPTLDSCVNPINKKIVYCASLCTALKAQLSALEDFEKQLMVTTPESDMQIQSVESLRRLQRNDTPFRNASVKWALVRQRLINQYSTVQQLGELRTLHADFKFSEEWVTRLPHAMSAALANDLLAQDGRFATKVSSDLLLLLRSEMTASKVSLQKLIDTDIQSQTKQLSEAEQAALDEVPALAFLMVDAAYWEESFKQISHRLAELRSYKGRIKVVKMISDRQQYTDLFKSKKAPIWANEKQLNNYLKRSPVYGADFIHWGQSCDF